MSGSGCDVCGKPADGDLCEEHEGTPVLYHLDDSCGPDDIVEGRAYAGVVNGTVDYGAFVDINSSISGLVHESNLIESVEEGDEIKVRVDEIRENGDLNLIPVHMHDYNEAKVERDVERTPVEGLDEMVGDNVVVEGEVVQTRQTGGPTIFTLGDESGVVDCAAFVEAGVRAYPEVDTGDIVRIRGEVELRDGELQIEASELEKLEEEEREEVKERLEREIERRAEPPELNPLVESPLLDDLVPGLRNVAKALRKAVFMGRPIIVRHHADADGISSGAVVEKAVVELIRDSSDDPDAAYHLFKRMPSRAPFYEMEDVTRDLNHALKDVNRHGHRDPVILMLDNGSTEEDTPAYEIARSYGIPIYIVDHHSPDSEVDSLVEEHVNPYLVDGDYSLTSGMMCTELARLVNPDVEEGIMHVPAVSGKGDRSESELMNDYLDLALDMGYTEERILAIADALDYESFWLKYDDGRHLINHILDIETNDAHEELVPKLKERADKAFERQMDAALPHVDEEILDNGVHLYSINIEKYTHKFTFPGPGKTTGKIHDTKVKENDDPVVTIGYGPDFCVIRGHGVGIDIPRMVTELKEELRGAGVDGGGHLVVGSIKFVEGMRDDVLVELVNKIEEAPVDEEYGGEYSDDYYEFEA